MRREGRAYFSDKAVEEFYNPKNMGIMMGPDGYGHFLGPCGDTMEIYLRLDGEKIVKAAFMTDGCGATAALDGLPEDHAHCAVLAVNTLRAAIAACG